MKQTSISKEFLELLTTMPFEVSINKLLDRGVKHIRTQFNTRDTYTLDAPDAVTISHHEVITNTVEVWGTGHFQKARNPYVCEECGGKITPKQRYMKRTDHTNMEVCQYCLSCAVTELKWATTYQYNKEAVIAGNRAGEGLTHLFESFEAFAMMQQESPMEQQQTYAVQKAAKDDMTAQAEIPRGLAEKALIDGDLSRLTPEERLNYYMSVCQSLQLNPLTKPFGYIVLNGKLTLYPKKDATEQLRKIRKIKITDMKRDTSIEGMLTVEVSGYDDTGRPDVDIGVVSIKGLQGDKLANAIMKAVTKAKRRFTLSICGLGMVDESEIETIPGARVVATEDLHPPQEARLQIDPDLIDQIKITLEKLAVFEPDAWEETYQRFQDAQKHGFPPRRYADGRVEPYTGKDFEERLYEYQKALASIEMKLAAIEKAESMPAGVNPLEELFDENPAA